MFPEDWVHGAWEVVGVLKSGSQLERSDVHLWRTFTFDKYRRFFVIHPGGAWTKMTYTEGSESGAFDLRPMVFENTEGKKAVAWKGWTVKAQGGAETGNAKADEVKLEGFIGAERYEIRAK